MERSIRRSPKALQRWQEVVVWVLDEGPCSCSLLSCLDRNGLLTCSRGIEVSMVDGHLFDRVCDLAERLRGKDRPPVQAS